MAYALDDLRPHRVQKVRPDRGGLVPPGRRVCFPGAHLVCGRRRPRLPRLKRLRARGSCLSPSALCAQKARVDTRAVRGLARGFLGGENWSSHFRDGALTSCVCCRVCVGTPQNGRRPGRRQNRGTRCQPASGDGVPVASDGRRVVRARCAAHHRPLLFGREDLAVHRLGQLHPSPQLGPAMVCGRCAMRS